MRWLFPLVVVVLLPVAVSAHPSHATMASVEWDQNRLEVSLQLQAADVSQALSARKKEAPSYEAAVQRLVRENMVLRDASGQVVPFEWVGMEEAKFGVWVYFQWTLSAPMESYTLEQTLFYETEPRTLHTVNFKKGKERKTRTFRYGEKAKNLPTFEKAARTKP